MEIYDAILTQSPTDLIPAEISGLMAELFYLHSIILAQPLRFEDCDQIKTQQTIHYHQKILCQDLRVKDIPLLRRVRRYYLPRQIRYWFLAPIRGHEEIPALPLRQSHQTKHYQQQSLQQYQD